MSETPRTDAASRGADFYTSDQPAFAVVVPVDFARSLERELSEVTRERDARGEALKRTAAYKFDRDLKRLEEELIGAITRAEAAERELEALRGKLGHVLYQTCAKHIGMPWTFTATTVPYQKIVCPICIPPEK